MTKAPKGYFHCYICKRLFKVINPINKIRNGSLGSICLNCYTIKRLTNGKPFDKRKSTSLGFGLGDRGNYDKLRKRFN